MSLSSRLQNLYRSSFVVADEPTMQVQLTRPAAGKHAGPVYAFVPAHGDSRVGAVQEQLGCTWSEDLGLSVLLVDFEARREADLAGGPDRQHVDGKSNDSRKLKQMLEQTGKRYDVVCVDLTHASPELSKVVLELAHSIFLVSDSDQASLETTRDRMRLFDSLHLEDRCALLLRRIPGGLRPDLAEDVAGAPVCGLVETSEQMARLARWLATPQQPLAAVAMSCEPVSAAHSVQA